MNSDCLVRIKVVHIDLQSLHIIINITLLKIVNLALTLCIMHMFQSIFSKHVEILKYSRFLKMQLIAMYFYWNKSCSMLKKTKKKHKNKQTPYVGKNK